MSAHSEKFIEVLKLEADSVARAADRIDASSAATALELLLGCSSKVVVLGVGKSAVIAEKISQTMTSTGTVALFLHGSDALHGSLGAITEGDVVIALSNSGETDELLSLLPTIKNRGIKLISIVGNTASTLARQSDVVLDASVDKEACPHNLAPTTSTTVALAIGDALAMALMEAKGIAPEDFAMNHPAGRLGKRLTITVANLMHESPNISPSATFVEVVGAISKFALGAVNVVDAKGELVGIITDGDLRRTIERTAPESLAALNAEGMMTKGPISIGPDTLAFDALKTMENRPSQIAVLPVVDADGRAVGLLRVHDIVRTGL